MRHHWRCRYVRCTESFRTSRIEAAMTLRDTLFAMTYDRQIASTEKAGLRALRESLLAGVRGDVLEIGSGTGANLPLYHPALNSLTMTEPHPPMLRRLERKARDYAPAAKVLRAPAEDLPFEDSTFDVAVSTLVCAASTTSHERCGNCGACCDPAAGWSSSSTSAPMIRARPGCRTG